MWQFAPPYSNANILKTKYFFWVFFSVSGIYIKFEIFSKKKKIVMAIVFLKLQKVKNLVRTLSKKRCFRTSFQSQHVKISQTLMKAAGAHFYYIFSSFWEEMIWEMSPLFKFEVIEMFFNTLTAADYKYAFLDSNN